MAVASTGPLVEEDPRDLEAAVVRACDRALADAPTSMPAPDRQCARRGFAVLYDLCRFVINRHLPIEALVVASVPWSADGATPAEVFGVDVAFRHLRAVHRQAAERNADDPLVRCVLVHAQAWPLAGVGIPASGDDPAALIAHPALRLLYVDRVIARGDVVRARHPALLPYLRAALGAHPDLVPALREVLA